VDRQKYLRKVILRKIEILATQVLVVIAFIAIWEILAQTGKIDSFITSQPSRIMKTFMNLSSYFFILVVIIYQQFKKLKQISTDFSNNVTHCRSCIEIFKFAFVGYNNIKQKIVEIIALIMLRKYIV